MAEADKDILQPLPLEEWPLVQSHTKLKWPCYAYLYYWLENSIRWKRKNPDINIQIYCPNGDYKCGTFVAISNFAIYIVITFSLDETGETLKRAIAETKLIDWDQGVYFAATHSTIAPFVLSAIDIVKQTRTIELESVSYPTYYFKSAEECVNVDIHVPDDCYLKTLDKSHIPYIHRIWPHKDSRRPHLSIKYLTYMVELNCGLGLFRKEDDLLVSWALHTDWYGMGMVQTVEEHKRKGYARIVINGLAKRLGEEGVPTTLFIVEGNNVSEKMFLSLGWNKVTLVSWIILKRQDKQTIANT